jgi:outer membrane murein-binding lipoprotein Lpp
MMISRLATAASVIPLTALMLSACVSQSSYDALQAQNQQLQAQNQQLQAQVSGLQREASFVEAGDLLFPEGGYSSAPSARRSLATISSPSSPGCRTLRSSSTATPTICRSERH